MDWTRMGSLSATEVAQRRQDSDPTAVLVTGSCEQHAAHLPVDTDTFLAEQVAAQACQTTQDILLPVVGFGYNEKELSFAGTVSLPATVFLDVVVGIGRSLRRSGWARLMIVNGHGWNNDIVRVATHMLNEEPRFRAASCSYWNLCGPEVRELRESPVPGGMAHACEFETSMMLHLRPESVRLDRIEDEISYLRLPHLHHDLLEKSPIGMPEQFSALSASGVIGFPSLATAEKGRVWFEAAARRLAEFLSDFRRAFPTKEAPS